MRVGFSFRKFHVYKLKKASNNPNCLHSKDDEYVHVQIMQYVHNVKVPVVKTMNVPLIIVTSCMHISLGVFMPHNEKYYENE